MMGADRISVMLLCGGTGLRMRGAVEQPKALTEIGGRPIFWHIMKHYAKHGFDDFVLCLGHLGHQIKQYFIDYDLRLGDVEVSVGRDAPPRVLPGSAPRDRFDVKLVETGEDAQTGARVARAAKYLAPGTFMVTYADGVGDVDLSALLAFHRAHGKIGTVTVIRPHHQYALLKGDAKGVVESWLEKPRTEDVLTSAGYFVFERKFFDYLRDDNALVLEREPLEQLVRDRELMMYVHDGFWQSMDTAKDLQRLNDLWWDAIRRDQAPPWRVW
jgi:glucose-1-phosphate cytidylyltransferase